MVETIGYAENDCCLVEREAFCSDAHQHALADNDTGKGVEAERIGDGRSATKQTAPRMLGGPQLVLDTEGRSKPTE